MFKILYEKPGVVPKLVTADKINDHVTDIILNLYAGMTVTIEPETVSDSST